jgi:hypothetical protein
MKHALPHGRHSRLRGNDGQWKWRFILAGAVQLYDCWGANPDISPRFCVLFRQKAEIRISVVSERTVIPAKAGIHRRFEAWIPAFAGMTVRFGLEST